jgi:hypothetical protein
MILERSTPISGRRSVGLADEGSSDIDGLPPVDPSEVCGIPSVSANGDVPI